MSVQNVAAIPKRQNASSYFTSIILYFNLNSHTQLVTTVLDNEKKVSELSQADNRKCAGDKDKYFNFKLRSCLFILYMSLACLTRFDIKTNKQNTQQTVACGNKGTGNTDSLKSALCTLVFLYKKDLLNCMGKFLSWSGNAYGENE